MHNAQEDAQNECKRQVNEAAIKAEYRNRRTRKAVFFPVSDLRKPRKSCLRGSSLTCEYSEPDIELGLLCHDDFQTIHALVESDHLVHNTEVSLMGIAHASQVDALWSSDY